MAIVTTNDAHYAAIADAIRAKTGGSDTYTPAEMAAAIEGISGGGAEQAPRKDVNFYDYDGFRVASYTIAEAQALTALPSQPTHDGLTGQGWNYTLAQVKATTRPMNVGAMYITDDGKTRIYLTLPFDLNYTIQLFFIQDVSGGVTIDWGDGTTPETVSGTGSVSISHTYALAGTYVIAMQVTDGTMSFDGAGDEYGVLSYPHCMFVTKVEFGSGVSSIYQFSFENFTELKSITIPNGLSSIGRYSFAGCATLRCVVIPSSVDTIDTSVFYDSGIEIVSMPESTAYIGQGHFQYCPKLKNIAIPLGMDSISIQCLFGTSLQELYVPEHIIIIRSSACGFTPIQKLVIVGDPTIEDQAFYNCRLLKEIRLLSSTPPTLYDDECFYGLPEDCVIYVPAASLTAYQTATNWAEYADYMVGE